MFRMDHRSKGSDGIIVFNNELIPSLFFMILQHSDYRDLTVQTQVPMWIFSMICQSKLLRSQVSRRFLSAPAVPIQPGRGNTEFWNPWELPKLCDRNEADSSVRDVRSRVRSSLFLQIRAGSTELKIRKASLVDKMSRYLSKIHGKRYWPIGWRFTILIGWVVPLLKVQQSLEKRRSLCASLGFPCSLQHKLPDPQYHLPYLIFQVMKLQVRGSIYILHWCFSWSKCHSSNNLNIRFFKNYLEPIPYILYNLLNNAAR